MYTFSFSDVKGLPLFFPFAFPFDLLQHIKEHSQNTATQISNRTTQLWFIFLLQQMPFHEMHKLNRGFGILPSAQLQTLPIIHIYSSMQTTMV